MTVEELEIIVRAKVNEAITNIKKLVKEVKKETSSLEKTISGTDFSKININISSKVKNETDKVKKDVSTALSSVEKSVQDTAQKCYVWLNNAFSGLDTKQLDEVKKKFGDFLKTNDIGQIGIEFSHLDEVTKFVEQLDSIKEETIKPNVDVSQATQQIAMIKNQMSGSSTMNVSANVSSTGEVPKVDMTANLQEITTFGQALRNAMDTIKREMTDLSSLRIDTSNWLEEHGVINKAKSIASSVANSFSNLGGKMGNIGNSLAIPFDMIKEKAGSFSKIFDKPVSGAKKFLGFINQVKTKINDVTKSGKNINGIGNAFEKGIGSIKKFALSLLSVRTAFSLVSKAAQSYLSFDESLNQSIQNSWNTLGSLLAPVLELVASLFSKATSYVAAFVKALTGIDLVAKANAKALDKQAKSNEKANKQLSGIDDLNNLTSSSGSEEETPTITTEPIDPSSFDGIFSFIDEAKKKLATLFQPIKKSWDTYGAGLVSSIQNAFSGIGELISGIYTTFEAVWTNGTGEEYMNNLLIGWTNIFSIISNIATTVADVWTNTGLGQGIIQTIFDIINGSMETVNAVGTYFKNWTLSDSFKNAVQFVLQTVQSILNFIQSITTSIQEWVVSESFQQAVNNVLNFLTDILGYIKDIAGWLLEMYEKYAKPVLDQILLLITDVINLISTIWTNVVKPVLDPIIDILKNTLEPIIKAVGQAFGSAFEVLRTAINTVTGVINNFATLFKQIFTGDFKGALETLKNIWNTIWDALKNTVKSVLNGIIGFANLAIDGVNAILSPIRGIIVAVSNVFGGNVSMDDIKIPHIPTLATGNVATEPTLAVFAEYANAKSNPEITSPVSIMRDTFREVLSEFDLGGTRVDRLVVDVAGENLFDKVIEYINAKSSYLGVNVIKDVE